MADRAIAIVVMAGLAAAAGCAPASTLPPSPTPAQCVLVDEPARGYIVIAARDADAAFEDHMYSPARIASAQMHETLVRVDCTGAPTAALAREWSTADSVRWHFRIAAGGTFSDGTPVDAPAIVSAWSAGGTAHFSEVMAAGTHDLHVTLRAPAGVSLFALPELAVVRPGAHGWPAGTGRYSADSTLERGVLRLIAHRGADGATRSTDAPDTIDVRMFGRDLRRAVDLGVDALIAHDAATIAYARARSGYVIEPLPWSRTYVLATVSPLDSIAAPEAASMFPAELVRASMRSAEGPYWWQHCRTADAPRQGTADGRILYDRDDEIARAIAERIAALARGRAPDWLADLVRSSVAPRAVATTPSEMLAALRSRTALIVITSLPRVRYIGCPPASHPWDVLLRRWNVTPLIDMRHQLVYRPGIGRVIVDDEGMIRFGAR